MTALILNARDTAMTPDAIKACSLYSLAFNYAILIIWFGVLVSLEKVFSTLVADTTPSVSDG